MNFFGNDRKELMQLAIDALPHELVILNKTGIIVSANQQWHDFATKNEFPTENHGIGFNYLSVCQNAEGKEAREAQFIANGIQKILKGEQDRLYMEYPCHSPEEERWFACYVRPFEWNNERFAVLLHENITDRVKAREDLISSEARLNLSQEIAHIGSWEFDTASHQINWSQETFRIFDFDPEEGAPSFEELLSRLYPEEQNVLLDLINRAISEGESYEVDQTIQLPNGTTRLIKALGQPLYNDTGEVIKLHGTMIDVTEQRQTEAEIKKLALVARETDNAVIITGPDELIEWTNPGFTRITGYTLDEIIGKQPGKVLQGQETDPETVDRIRQAIENQKSIQTEILNYTKDGRPYWVDLHVQPVFDDQGQLMNFIAVKSDITKRKLAEQALQDAFETIKAQQEKLNQELEQARQTQKSLLPPVLPDIPRCTLATKYVPIDQIGGDFYDVFSLPAQCYGIAVADVTGHGISAALVSFMVSGFFKNISREIYAPQRTLEIINDLLVKQIPEGRFATFFYGVYDSINQTLTYASAGHPPAYLLNSETGELRELRASGPMLGVFSCDIVRFKQDSCQLVPGEKLFFYTDAIYEIQNSKNMRLGFDRLKEFIIENRKVPIGELLEKIYALGVEFSESVGFNDDVTMIGLELNELANEWTI